MNALVLKTFIVLALVAVIRALPWSEETKQKKPLGCDACMVWWCAIALGSVDMFRDVTPFAAAGAAWVLLTWLRKGELLPPSP